jgi:hypothetical protein
MLKKYFFLLLIVSFSVALSSCEKISSEQNEPPQSFDFQNPIPLEYGTLVDVTAHPTLESWALLWFVKSDGTITGVWVDSPKGKIVTVITIPRK